MKPVIWLGDSLDRVRHFPPGAKRESGYQLGRVQSGREPKDWKPMASIGAGVNEIRVHVDGEFRVIYVARFVEAVYVLHAFQKKTRKTARLDLEAAQRRLRMIFQQRNRA